MRSLVNNANKMRKPSLYRVSIESQTVKIRMERNYIDGNRFRVTTTPITALPYTNGAKVRGVSRHKHKTLF